MNNTPTPTPETNASRHDLSDYGIPVPCSYGDWVPFNVAERLERELTAVTKERDRLAEAFQDMLNDTLTPTNDEWIVTDNENYIEIASIKTCDSIASVHGGKTIGDQYDLAGRIARVPQLERELTAARQELKAVTEQRDEWKSKYIQQNKDLGCEMMDPNGTIWDYAKKLQTELAAAREEIDMMGIRYAAAEMHHANNMQEVTEQRDEARREAEKYRNLITNVKGWKYDLPWEKPDAVKGGADE